MPFDGSGNFIRTFPAGGWQGDAAANIKIKADRHDQHDSDLASGLSNAICKDGQSSPTADIPMNGKKITNLGAPVAPTDAATRYYVDNSTGRARISDGPPSSPVAGDLWWDSDSGNLLVYYNDGDSLQWVQTNVSAPVAAQPGIFKISSGILAANTANVEIPLPTSGYHSFELIGAGLTPTGGGAGSYSAVVQFSVAGVWKTGATDYASTWDAIMSTAAASAGWSAGSSTASPYAIFVPFCYLDQSWHFFKLSMPQVTNGQSVANFICESHGYGNGAWTRARSGGNFIGPAGVAPDRIRVTFIGVNIVAGFKWQLNGIR